MLDRRNDWSKTNVCALTWPAFKKKIKQKNKGLLTEEGRSRRLTDSGTKMGWIVADSLLTLVLKVFPLPASVNWSYWLAGKTLKVNQDADDLP